MNFTEEQLKVINQINGPVIVVACPGSGKTTTVLERTKHMIESGIDPKTMLVVTFTKNAADEMATRFKSKYGMEDVIFSTIHSLCFSVLVHHDYLNHTNILKEWEQYKFFKDLLFKSNTAIMNADNVCKDVISKISYVRNSKGNPQVELSGFMVNEISYYDLYTKYQAFKRQSGKIDFDDMMLRCHEIFCTDKRELEHWQNIFSYFTIDEFQDTNIIQSEIFYMLCEKSQNICVVGDDDQSIYGFRSADSSIMLNFEKEFPAAKRFYLDVNYRSGKKIVEKASNLISYNKIRFDKKFEAASSEDGKITNQYFSEEEEERAFLLKELKRLIKKGNDLTDTAILYRLNSTATMLVNVLEREKIPFHLKEMPDDIHKSFIFKDLQIYYKLANIPIEEWDNNTFVTALMHPSRFFKKSDWQDFTPQSKRNIYKKCIELYSDSAWKKNQQLERLDNFFLFLNNLSGKTPDSFVKTFFQNRSYHDWAIEYGKKFQGKEESVIEGIIEALYEEAGMFDTMDEWIQYGEEFANKMREKNKKKEGVLLSTFHGSKGLEWENVYIIAANNGITPFKKAETDAEIEEERRMFYVAVTRAKNNLTITALKRKRSYFIEEMEKPCTELKKVQ